jgi:hypothetical protein
MSDLIVVGFHGKHRAAEVLDQLQQLMTSGSSSSRMEWPRIGVTTGSFASSRA